VGLFQLHFVHHVFNTGLNSCVRGENGPNCVWNPILDMQVFRHVGSENLQKCALDTDDVIIRFRVGAIAHVSGR
jgi:hypothetical protein